MRALAASLALLLAVGMAAGCGGDDDDESEAGAASLEGIPWILASGLDAEGWEEAPPSVTFEDGNAGGSTGCNRWGTSYTVDGDSLELGEITSTQIACPPPADGVERAYLAALGEVAGWSVDGAELVLVDADDGELLRYAEASPVGEWEVTAFLDGDAVSSPLLGTTITATFAEDGTLSGSAGCNNYTTTFTTDGGAIEIGEVATTRMFCPEPEGVMEQEAAWVAALPAAVSYRVDGGSLSLLTADGTYVASLAPAQR